MIAGGARHIAGKERGDHNVPYEEAGEMAPLPLRIYECMAGIIDDGALDVHDSSTPYGDGGCNAAVEAADADGTGGVGIDGT